jgi:ubiquinone/menaquinone biosynthesis C-methylase UbiE
MTTPGRQFNAAVTRFWSIAAPVYDLPVLQRWVYRPGQDEVVAKLRAAGSRRIADIACGTGILTARMRNELRPDEIYGVDMSDGMLEQAKARSTQVRWMKGPAEQLPFEDASLDAVVTTSAFFDQPAAMREFHRVLAPGGLAAVATITPPLPPALDRFVPKEAGVLHSPRPAELRKLFTDAGFVVTDQRRVDRPVWTRMVGDLITVGTKV